MRLHEHATAPTSGMALLPGDQLEMLKLLCDQTAVRGRDDPFGDYGSRRRES
ncbi:hypothetical protein AB0K48_40600 [Nonomuraea sp. NPDC055795]